MIIKLSPTIGILFESALLSLYNTLHLGQLIDMRNNAKLKSTQRLNVEIFVDMLL